MATTINYLSLTGLQRYDASIKEFITTKVDAGDEKSFKYVNLENGVLKFYTVNPISEDTVAAYEVELPEQDLSYLMQLVDGAVNGNIAVFGDNGQIVDSGVAVADLATKAEVELVDDKVDALDELVGELPEGTSAISVVDYVNIKTAGIATDAALEELNNQVSGLQTAVQGIQADYLVEADKTELQGNIDDVDAKVDANAEAIKAIQDNYLKDTDKTELQNQITANANAIELLTNGVDAETVDGVNDLITYVNEHGAEVTKMQGDIADNTAAIEAEAKARADADEAMDTRVKVLEAIDYDAYVDADATLKAELEEDIAKKANASVVTALDEAYKAADTALSDRITIVEGKAHEHANKDVLDGITADGVASWDDATDKAHVHENADVLASITAENVTAWSNAEANAKAYVDEKIEGVDLSGIATNASAIEVLEGKVDTLETDVAALKEVSHVEITTEQIDALFETAVE